MIYVISLDIYLSIVWLEVYKKDSGFENLKVTVTRKRVDGDSEMGQ